MGPESSLPYSQDSTTCLYSERVYSSPCSLPTSRRSVLIVSSHLCPCLASGSFHSVFPTKNVCIPLLYSIRATCPAFLIPLDFIMFMQLVLSVSTSTTFSLPSGLHPTQLSVCTSKVLSPSLIYTILNGAQTQ